MVALVGGARLRRRGVGVVAEASALALVFVASVASVRALVLLVVLVRAAECREAGGTGGCGFSLRGIRRTPIPVKQRGTVLGGTVAGHRHGGAGLRTCRRFGEESWNHTRGWWYRGNLACYRKLGWLGGSGRGAGGPTGYSRRRIGAPPGRRGASYNTGC